MNVLGNAALMQQTDPHAWSDVAVRLYMPAM